MSRRSRTPYDHPQHPYHSPEAFRNLRCPVPPRTPRLFRSYLELSARLCGPPAIDRDFRTIDFLTLLDLCHIPERVRAAFLAHQVFNAVSQLNALENQSDELFWAHEAAAPLCVGGGRGFGSDNFIE